MSLRNGKNIASIGAQRRLNQATDDLSSSYERLGSGLRINSASDDAAGLSVSSSLQADSRVYAQGIKNINDGISLLNVAQGALSQLSDIATRQEELAEQAANGVYSLTQRKALDKEANALKDEWNRIVDSTSFNGTKLFDGSLSGGLSIQSGYGTDGGVEFAIGQKLSRTVGTGSFSPFSSYSATGGADKGLILLDVNKDGKLDAVTSDGGFNALGILQGNGDGSFNDVQLRSVYGINRKLGGGDLNGDGLPDLISADYATNSVSVLMQSPIGSFSSPVTFTTGMNPYSVDAIDINGDAILDLITVDGTSSSVSVLIGNGNGSFRARTSYSTSSAPRSLGIADFNSDGLLDLVVSGDSGLLDILVGDNNGKFSLKSPASLMGPILTPSRITTGDVNSDGNTDVVAFNYYWHRFSVVLGNGDGTFQQAITLATGNNPIDGSLADIDGDGFQDLVVSGANESSIISVHIGNGNGSFNARTSFGPSSGWSTVKAVDINRDEVCDVVLAANGSVYSYLADTSAEARIARLNLLSQSSARDALTTIRAAQDRVSAELGAIGAIQSRLGIAARNLLTQRENYIAASSRITDADIAQESARLTSTQIRQQGASAVLAQANQSPALVLQLLG